ncbi:unnamed protein product [Lymnaea stagnalis]|uniref:Uncharacterized protein n=1 Tax=Lymnaea stagnalis TaxID=6523 RepID=A0AAV2HLT4_LYMST
MLLSKRCLRQLDRMCFPMCPDSLLKDAVLSRMFNCIGLSRDCLEAQITFSYELDFAMDPISAIIVQRLSNHVMLPEVMTGSKILNLVWYLRNNKSVRLNDMQRTDITIK